MSEDIIDVENDIKPLESNQVLDISIFNKVNESNLNQETFDFAEPLRSISNKNVMVDEILQYSYPTQLTHTAERENWIISTDHCYARPWNWKSQTNFLRAIKTLFVPKLVGIRSKSNHPLAPSNDKDDVVDVEMLTEQNIPTYDINKANTLMEECENYAISTRVDVTDEDWEDKICRSNWNTSQNRIFNGMVNILNSFNLSKLSQTDVRNEPLLRRTVIDKAVQRIRRLLTTVSWEPKIVQWLHQTLLDHLGATYLGAYLDILQTLKSKLPTFVDKMMFAPNSSLRIGPLNNSNLYSLLERPWDPIASSLIQDKPKKLPGSPLIIIVPNAPILSKRMNKWIKYFSYLGTVITIPINFGPTAHRIALANGVDQMFSITRGKLQDIKTEYPGRHIILLGFNAGGTLALQVAQMESVLCVISLGFSLLTAEGKRGESDDNLLELQCPVLFVIGQCSNTSMQEDMEDLRERMRVETGLIIVGSADDYLRVDKKKKKAEGITQSVVDRCIVDEVGEFISGIILSPFPPQFRQSPTNLSPDTGMKKCKIERKRYNSNTSSLDSEPPSPTRQISRPGLNNSPTNSRIQPYGLNKSVADGLNSAILQGSTKTITQTPSKPSGSAIKVLENVTLNSNATAKLISNNGRTIDLSKITVINSVKGSNTANVLLLPDGKLKTIHNSSIKGTSGTPILLPLSPQRGSMKANKGKYITAKRQLVSAKPSHSIRKSVYIPTSSVQSTLPPPANLTTQDIMDLPIIFADDNQMLETPFHSDLSTNFITVPDSNISKGISCQTSGKFMLLNKHTNSYGNFIITPNSIKKTCSLNFGKQTPKYTKIILSSKKTSMEEIKSHPQIHNFLPEITLKKVASSENLSDKKNTTFTELVDLENEIEATAVPKPNLLISDGISGLSKTEDKSEEFHSELVLKRASSIIDVDGNDPDYIPPKNLKLK